MLPNKKITTILFLILLLSGCSFKGGAKDDNWKIGCDDNLGIEFKYPSDWTSEDKGGYFYLYDNGRPGNVLMMKGGSFSDLESDDIKKDEHIIDSNTLEINGIKVIVRKYKQIEPKNIAAVKGYFFNDDGRWVAVMNNFFDINGDVFEKIVKSVRVLGVNRCVSAENKAGAEHASTTINNENTDNASYSLKADENNPGWNVYEDKIDSFIIGYPDSLVYVKDAGKTPFGSVVFQIQFPYNQDRGEVSDIAKMSMIKHGRTGNESLFAVAEERAEQEGDAEVYACAIGGKEAACFNSRVYFNDIEIKNYYSKTALLEKGDSVYEVNFFASEKIKDEFKNIFNQIENRIEFIE
jgi:hypothetical protein